MKELGKLENQNKIGNWTIEIKLKLNKKNWNKIEYFLTELYDFFYHLAKFHKIKKNDYCNL